MDINPPSILVAAPMLARRMEIAGSLLRSHHLDRFDRVVLGVLPYSRALRPTVSAA